MGKFDFLKEFVFPEGKIVNQSESKYCFYPVHKSDILKAEEQLSIKFPTELTEFYLEVGYGYIGQDEPDFMNVILHPLEIAKLASGQGFYKNMDPKDLGFYTSKSVLPFFNLGGEAEYLVLKMDGKDREKVFYFSECIANSFFEFVMRMCEKTDYFIDFDD